MEKAIKEYGTTKPLVFIKSATNIAAYIKDACGKVIKLPYIPKLSWVKSNSTGGRIDFWYTYLTPELIKIGYNINISLASKDAGPFYVFNGSSMTYNVMDAGNFLWGRSMRVLGISKSDMKTGEMYNDSHDPITDQMAVLNGYNNNTEETKKYGLPIMRNDPNQSVKYDSSESKSTNVNSSSSSSNER